MIEEKRPQADNLGAETQTINSTKISIPETADMRPIQGDLIGCTVEKPLEAALWRLRLGEIGLEELTPALAGFCTLFHADGFKAGVESVQPALKQATADADRYWRAAFAPALPIRVGPSYAELEKRRHTFGDAE